MRNQPVDCRGESAFIKSQLLIIGHLAGWGFVIYILIALHLSRKVYAQIRLMERLYWNDDVIRALPINWA